ncbi:NAD(P)-binding protein [Tricholoma matsutake]|nr:NAD(P)-binding protein [Tricholoma matsutake 945]
MSQTITAQVKAFYSGCATSSTQPDKVAYNDRVATVFGYSAEELRSIPDKANLGLSCGNPLATANLKEGETLVDLGSGGGLDVFNAARKVGPTGKAIGVDMTDNMLELARKNAVQGGYTNVEFVKSNITSMVLPNGIADIVCSNCVINLVPEPEKPAVFHEIFRILKPGGRLAISDILAKQPLPESIRKDAEMLVGCISGASMPSEYKQWMSDAGFEDIIILDTKKDINAYQDPQVSSGSGCCGSASARKTCTPVDLNVFVGSFQIYAVKA